MNESQLLLDFINGGGSIPVTLVLTSTSNWSQFVIQVFVALMSSALIFMIIGKPYIQRYKQRKFVKKLKKIYRKLGRNFLIIRNSNQQGLFDSDGVMIDRDMHLEIARKLQDMKGKDIDLYLHTPVGEIFATQSISRLLRNHKGKLRAVVPFYSMSGGTYLALSCDEVYLSDTACLGAVDPQIGNLFKFGSAKAWDKILKFKGKKAEDSSISFAYIGKQYTKTMKQNLKVLLKDKIKDEKLLKKAIDTLTSGDIEHGYPFIKEDLRKIGLEVKDLEPHMYEAVELFTKHSISGVFGSDDKNKWFPFLRGKKQ